MTFRKVFVALLTMYAAALISHAQDDCGSAPNEVYVSSHEWNKAVTKLVSSSSDPTLKSTATVPVKGVPVKFGLDATDPISDSELNTLSEHDAQKTIHDSIGDRLTAVVAECRYGLCKAHSPEAIAAMQKVCTAAIIGPEDQEMPSQINLSPGRATVIFEGLNPVKYTLLVTNHTPGYVKLRTFAVGQTPSLVSVISPAHRFRVPPNGSVTVVASVRRPTKKVTELLQFSVVGRPDISAKLPFVLVPSADDLLPAPALGCGTVATRATVIATSDTPVTFPDKKFEDVKSYALAQGNNDLSNLYSEYLKNGGSLAGLSSTAVCNPQTADEDSVGRTVSITANLRAQSGYCCGGANSGVVVNFRPVWNTQVLLPGLSGKNLWSLHVDSLIQKNGPGASCVVSVDNGVATRKSISVTAVDFYDQTAIRPGTHSLELDCSASDCNSGRAACNGLEPATERR